MALIDKLGHVVDTDSISIATHSFAAAIHLWADGTITRQNVIDAFGLDATDEAQLDELKTVYNGQPTNLAKLAYVLKVERILILLETKDITRAQAKTFLGLA